MGSKGRGGWGQGVGMVGVKGRGWWESRGRGGGGQGVEGGVGSKG